MNYKEIVTKAVIAKGKKNSTNSYTLEPEEVPNTILGCWVINHSFNGTNLGNSVLVNGSFDVNVWYSYDNDSKTAVSNKKFNYTDTMRLKNGDLDSSNEVIVKSIKQPTVSDVFIKDGVVNLSINKELGIEIVGDTKIKVPVEDLDDDYIDLSDSDEEIDSAVDKVNTEYLK
ncbi:MAG: outer spore coat protein CotE [bacterium]|nr:outer spore coat protein CotE [bacterium]